MVLTEDDKLLFALQLSVAYQLQRQIITPQEVRVLVTECKELDNFPVNPCIFFDDREWPRIYQKLQALNTLPAFSGILEDF